MNAICDSRGILRRLGKACQVAGCVFFRGFVDLFHNPKTATGYYRRIVGAALYSTEGKVEQSLGLLRCNINQAIFETESLPVTLIE